MDLTEDIRSLRRTINDWPGDDMTKIDLLLVRSVCVSVLSICETLADTVAELSEVSQAALKVVAAEATSNPALTPMVNDLNGRLLAAGGKLQAINASIARTNPDGDLNDE